MESPRNPERRPAPIETRLFNWAANIAIKLGRADSQYEHESPHYEPELRRDRTGRIAHHYEFSGDLVPDERHKAVRIAIEYSKEYEVPSETIPDTVQIYLLYRYGAEKVVRFYKESDGTVTSGVDALVDESVDLMSISRVQREQIVELMDYVFARGAMQLGAPREDLDEVSAALQQIMPPLFKPPQI